MILDYSHTQERRLHYRLASTEPDYVQGTLYNTRTGWCPYDNKSTELVFDGFDPLDSPHGGGENLKIWSCDSCGYWQSSRTSTWWNDLATLEGQNLIEKHSMLRHFDIDSVNIPISTLRNYLKSKPNLIYRVAPKSMELLVKSVFSDFFECNVYHCGQSNDGGVDLYFVQSHKPIFVQVKRRETPNKTEPVNTIRDFLGAMMLKEAKKGYFVSTAKKFSKEAHNAAKKAETLGLVETYDLINYHRFFEILNLVHKENTPPWKKYIEDYYDLVEYRNKNRFKLKYPLRENPKS